MSSPSEEEKESQETQFTSDSAGFDFELRLDTQTDDLPESLKQNSSSSDDGKFAAPASRPSLHSSNTSNDEKLFFTASQDTIPLSEFEDSKLGSLSKNSSGFEHSADSGILTPNSSADVKPSNSQDFFVTTCSGNQSLDRLSQKPYGAFSSSTPVQDSESDIDLRPTKRIKLDPDVDLSVESNPKQSLDKSDILMADVSQELVAPLKSSDKKTPQSQDSGGTILLDSSNNTPPPTVPQTSTESDLTLNYTQSVSQVQALTDVEAPKHSSNGISHSTETLDSSRQKSSSSNSWGSHNYDYLSYDSHYESHKNSTAASKNGKSKSEDQLQTFEKLFTCTSGPFRATIKEVFCAKTSKLLHHEFLELSFSPDLALAKEYHPLTSSPSSGVLGDISSGSSGVYSQPGPFPLPIRKAVLSSGSDSSGGHPRERKLPGRRTYHMVNGNKIFHSQIVEPVPSKCCNCKQFFPASSHPSSSGLNGTTNGKPESVPVQTPDNFSLHVNSENSTRSLPSNSEGEEARPPSDSTVSLQELLISKDNPCSNQSIVFGYWSKEYYPCRIIESSPGDDKYKVEYLDSGDVKDLSKNKLISLDMLVPGVCLKVQVPSGKKGYTYIIGELQEFPAVNTEAPFSVKVRNEIKYFPIESIAIGEQQRKQLMKINNPVPPANFSSIDLDNCTNAKRNRTPRQSTIVCTASPRTARSSARKLFKNVECKASTSGGKVSRSNRKSAGCKGNIEPKFSSNDSDFEFKKYQLDLSGNGIREVHLEKKDLDDPHTNDLRQKNITSLNDDKDLIKKYGPIPAKGSNLFSGFVFVLSCSDGVLLKPQPESLSSGTETDQGDEFLKCHYPFSKSRLMTQIKAGGGVYYENITDVPFSELKNTVLISNKPSLTCTYIYALAEGIRAYTQDNIVHCCINSIPFKEFIETSNYLPTGYSFSAGYKQVSKKKLVNEDGLRPRLLKNRWILLLLDPKTKKECFDFWTAILEIAGGHVKRDYVKYGTDESPVYAIADGSCPPDILEKKDIQCVSILWLIQSLINNTLLKPESHPYFKYDFKTGSTDDSG